MLRRLATGGRRLSSRSILPSQAVAVSKGADATESWRMFFAAGEGKASPWHDFELYTSGNDGSDIWYMCEIPKGTRPKLEVATKEEHNPIKQDTKKGKLRVLAYGAGMPFNYGMLPRTFESPNQTCHFTGLLGDKDPIDVVDLSPTPLPTGAVARARVLGALALVDEGEIDWKVLVVPPTCSVTGGWRDVQDIPKDVLEAVFEWFRMYKTADGKPQNEFALNGAALPRAKALDVVEGGHAMWKALLAGKGGAGTESMWLPKPVGGH